MMAEYIDRDSIYATLADEHPFGWTNDDLAELFRQAKAADVVPVKHGRWIPGSDDDQDEGEFCCSLCFAPEFFPNGVPLSRYCYNCGAKMDEQEMMEE